MYRCIGLGLGLRVGVRGRVRARAADRAYLGRGVREVRPLTRVQRAVGSTGSLRAVGELAPGQPLDHLVRVRVRVGVGG